MFKMSNSPFEKQPKPATEKSLREKVTEALKEQARMTPEEREAERAGYMEELKRGGKVKLTPKEKAAHAERERRARELREQNG
jgi:hypothetical protein